ncbi:hypothetical protein KVV02_001570 [Mortierella alpina]|uniref:Rho-GAP domain-containing protein n=1 Tax=Mortierella alpina TaxID=64518 RepID=A0A9P8A8M0_MORAP|nr:hypothetical protein KVV02_001570 [Mortierella alpina]
MSSVRHFSSAKNLREQFKGPNTSSCTLVASSNASTYTASTCSTRVGNLEPPNGSPVSRQGSLLRSTSNGTLRRTRSIQQRKGIMSKVFADDESSPHSALPDLSMEMTLLIVKRCIKEIRERGKFTIAGNLALSIAVVYHINRYYRSIHTPGLTTKGILRQVQMGQNQKVVIDTIRMILDDDVSTELSPLHQVDIHLVAHAMKWAIRYSEETLVTYEDYQALYLNQDRDFKRFVGDLPPTNRTILLDLFSLCADVTLLAHLNNMTLVSVAKAISLSIMAEPEREFTTFDASLQQRNLWGAASEDLLRAFLRIKTASDLAMLDKEDEVDENRYICNETRVLKSARQRPTGGDDQARVALPARLDISVPSSANSSSIGWSANNGPMSACTPRSYATANGYFDNVLPPHSASPYTHSHAGGMFGASLSRSQSLAKSEASNSRPLSPATHHDDVTEYEELMQDKAHFTRIRQDPNNLLRPAEPIRRRSSVTDLENLYMLPMDIAAPTDGYESDPEVSHKHKGSSTDDSLIPDFADGLGWDFNRAVDLERSTLPSLTSFQNRPENKCGVIRSNSASSNGSGIGPNGPGYAGSPRSIRDLSKQQLHAMRLQQLQDQHSSAFPPLHRAQSQQDLLIGDHSPSPMDSPVPGGANSSRARVSHAIHPSHQQQQAGRHSPPKRNSGLRRSISLDPFITHGRIHKKPTDLQNDLLARDLALQVERDLVAEDIRMQLLKVRNADQQDAAKVRSEFELQSSPQDLEPLPGMSSRPPSLLPTDERPVLSRRPSLLPTDERPVLSTASSRRPSLLSSDERPIMSAVSSRRPSLLPSDERPSILSRRPSFLATDYSMNPKPMLELDMGTFPISPLHPAPLHPFQLEGEGPRKFENASRPRDLEVNVIFNPMPLSAPLSPRTEHKSKFQESFPEHPVSPPPGYATGKGNHDMMSPSASTVSSPKLQRHGSGSRTLNGPPTQSNSVASSSVSRNRPPPLNQSVSYSGVSTSSSLPSANGEGGRSKTSGFIRALSSKLRSKQSDDQLRPVRVNNQLVGAAASPPTLAPAMAATMLIPPAVSIEPPRLQLNFLDDVISPAIATAATAPGLGSSLRDGDRDHHEHDLPPASAPALMHPSRTGGGGGGGAGTLEGWKRDAQESLPMSSDKSGSVDEEATGPNSATAEQDQQDLRPKGFTGVRRGSATVFGSGHQNPQSLREQQQRRTLKKETSSPSLLTSESPLQMAAVAAQKDVSAVAAAVRAIEAATASKTLKQEQQDHSSQQQQQASILEADANSGEGSIPKKTDADENEFRFSTATLLKDGKLYYQLQWDQFSELGFKAPEQVMTEKNKPDQTPDGIHHYHHPRLSQEDPWRRQSSSSTTTIETMTTTTTTTTTTVHHHPHPTQPHQQLHQMKPASTAAANSGSISVDLPGQIGQVSMSKKAAKLMGLMEFQQDQGPTSGTQKETGPGEEVTMSKKAAKLMGLMEFQQDQGPTSGTQKEAGPGEEVTMSKKAAKLMGLMEFQQDQGPTSGIQKEAGPGEEMIMSKKAAKLMGLMEFRQDQGPNVNQQRRAGPSEAQKAAAMMAARESFMALTKDPKAMAVLKAGSNGGTGQPTIIGTGSFRRGSIVPEMEMNPLLTTMPPRPIITSKLGMKSAERDACDSPRGSMSAKSSPLSSAATAAAAPWSDFMTKMQPGSVAAGGGGHGSSASSPSAQEAPDSFETMETGFLDSATMAKAKKGHRLFGRKFKSGSKKSQLGQVFGSTAAASQEEATLPSIENGGKAGRKKRLLPAGVRRQDVMTKTVESMDEVFPWMCIEHMAGQESGWVMLEPVQDGAVGWVVIDKLEDEMEAMVRPNQSTTTHPQQQEGPSQLDSTAF